MGAPPGRLTCIIHGHRRSLRIAENVHLLVTHYATEARWAEETLGKVERGELPYVSRQ